MLIVNSAPPHLILFDGLMRLGSGIGRVGRRSGMEEAEKGIPCAWKKVVFHPFETGVKSRKNSAHASK
jgi:hypothetical protein